MTEKSKIEQAMSAVENSRQGSHLMGYPEAQKSYEWTPARLAHAAREAERNMEYNVQRLSAYMETNPNCLKKGHKKQIRIDLNMSVHTINKTLKWMSENGF